MENRFIDENGNPLGLLQQIEKENKKAGDINIKKIFSKPYKEIKSNIVYCGIEFLEKLKNILKK